MHPIDSAQAGTISRRDRCMLCQELRYLAFPHGQVADGAEAGSKGGHAGGKVDAVGNAWKYLNHGTEYKA